MLDINKLLKNYSYDQRITFLVFGSTFPYDCIISSTGTNLKLYNPVLMDRIRQCNIV